MDGGLSTALILGSVVQGVSTVGGLYASKQQAKLDRAQVNYETSQAELAAADAAFENTRSYRRALGAQINLAAQRGAPGSSTLMQFTTDTFANFTRDQAALSRKTNQISIAGKIAGANASSNRMARDMGLLGNYFGSVFSGINFNSVSAKLGNAPGGSSLGLMGKK